jgi:probable HAF family extracellular repeat protein
VRHLRNLASAATTALLLSAASAAQAAPTYDIIDLGTLGGASSFALDVNNNRQVTGNAQTPAGEAAPRLNSFVWSPATGTMTNIGVLPGSNNFSRGYAINDAGVVVGESDNNSSRAFRWDQTNGMVGLTRLAGDNDRGVAHGINNSGVIVGISSNGTASRPTMWTNGVAKDLGSIDGRTDTTGRAWAIANNGTAVGVTRTGEGTTSQATMWAGNTIVHLGSFATTAFSEAFAVNSSNIAVGVGVNGSTPSGTSVRRAVRWELAGGIPIMVELGSLGRTFSEAKDINEGGQIVGFASNISGAAQLAWLWDDGQMLDLNGLIDPESGWTLLSAEAINDRGDIVGYGMIDGVTHAFLLTAVPAPGAMAVFAPVALALMAWRTRARRLIA